MPNDAELLLLYAETNSQDAFATLVRRHLPFTYFAALRQVGGNAHRAQEVAQGVFTLLAKKARALSRHPALIGWLCTTTYYTAAKLRRAEQRRSQAEANAVSEADESVENWDQLRPVIDDLLLGLKERDRTAVLLRFFSNEPYGEIGRRLGLTENAARMRVERALEVLRTALSKRGVVSTSSALGALLTTQAIGAIPHGLAGAVSASAFSAAAGGGGVLFFMGSTLIKVGVVLGILAAGSAGFLLHRQSAQENVRLRGELADARRELLARTAEERFSTNAGRSHTPAEVAASPGASSAVSEPARGQAFPDLQKTLTRLDDLRNVGRATPADAIQTILWAIVNGDDRLSDMIMLNRPAREKAPAMMAALSTGERSRYPTPENVAALYLSKFVLEQIEAVKVQSISKSSQDTVEVILTTGEKSGEGRAEISMQWTLSGWAWKMKPSLIEAAKKDLEIRRRNSPGGAASETLAR